MDEILPGRSFVGATILDKIDGKLKHPLPPPPKSRDGTGKRGVLAFARLHHRSGEMGLHII